MVLVAFTFWTLTFTMKISSSSCDEERPFASEYKHISSTKRQRTWRAKASTLLLILNVIIMLGAVVCFLTLMATNRLKRPERIDCFDGESLGLSPHSDMTSQAN